MTHRDFLGCRAVKSSAYTQILDRERLSERDLFPVCRRKSRLDFGRHLLLHLCRALLSTSGKIQMVSSVIKTALVVLCCILPTVPIRSKKFGPSNQPPTPHLMPYVLFSRVSDVSRPVASSALRVFRAITVLGMCAKIPGKRTSVDVDVLVCIGTVSVAWLGAS